MLACHLSHTNVMNTFTTDLGSFDDETKVRLLISKLGPAEYVRYSNHILPEETRALAFSEAIQTQEDSRSDNLSHCILAPGCLLENTHREISLMTEDVYTV